MPRVAFRLLGPTELEIMIILWEHGRATVREVCTLIRLTRPVAYTTVLTVMGNLATKGLLVAEGTHLAGYIYRPALTKEELIAQALCEMLDDLQPTPQKRRRALLTLAA